MVPLSFGSCLSEQHYSWEPRHSYGAPLSTQNVLSRLMIPIQKIKVLEIMEDGITTNRHIVSQRSKYIIRYCYTWDAV